MILAPPVTRESPILLATIPDTPGMRMLYSAQNRLDDAAERLHLNPNMHRILRSMVEDALLNPLLLDGYIQIIPGMDWLISPGVGILSILCFTAIGIGLYQWRKR